MRKTALIMAMVLLLTMIAVPVAAQSVQPRMLSIVPELTFSGTTAKCNVVVSGDTMSDSLSAVIRLYRGNTCIATWTASDSGYLIFSQTKNVTAGYTYKLTVTATMNGVTYSPVSVTGSC